MTLAINEEVERIRMKVRPEEKIVFVSGSFNILHPGHLRLLRFASECGNRLVVGVFNNQQAINAYLDEQDRLEAVLAVSWVSEALLLDMAPEQFISVLKPEIVVKGKEHEAGYNPEQAGDVTGRSNDRCHPRT